ncbi:MAG: D-2-hydroxyacid dehydrogenase [Lachnospiraceae bacterium]|nr:D-2-hydroxyacid dehydrogenase [Lachnospiraceae bacterium]
MEKHVLVALSRLEARHQDLYTSVADGSSHSCRLTCKATEDVTKEDMADVNALIGFVPVDVMKASPVLEWVHLSWSGVDAFIGPEGLPESVTVCNARGAHGLAVSEHMLALTMMLVRRLHQYRDNQLQCKWEQMGNTISIESATVAVLGIGNIGGDYARKVKALGAHVLGVRRTNGEKPEGVDEQFTIDRLDEVLARADIVAMNLPGGEATANLMNEETLRKMKKGAFLINVGRGTSVDQDALIKVLEEEHLGGAAIDVCVPEPLPADHPLWKAKNLIITPHAASNYLLAETFERFVRISADNLKRYANGEPLQNVVDRNTGY